MERYLSGVRDYEDLSFRSFLSQLWSTARALQDVSSSVVWKVLQGLARDFISYKSPRNRRRDSAEEKEIHTSYLYKREGDFLLFPFQCDYCWFVNLKKREPNSESHVITD